MNTQKLITCTIITLVVVFGLDYLWYQMIMPDALSSAVDRENPDFLWMMIGLIVFSLLFCYMYPKGVGNGSKTQEGMRFGLLIGLIIFVPMSLIMYATTTIGSLSEFLVDAIFHIVQMMIAGIVIAHVSGIPSEEGFRGGGKSGGGDDDD